MEANFNRLGGLDTVKEALANALTSNDAQKAAEAQVALCEQVAKSIMQEAELAKGDVEAMRARNVHVLTSKEREYYEKVIAAMKDGADISNIDVVMPKTIIDAVFEDLTTNHPLLGAINFVNTEYFTEWLINTNEAQTAAWGDITDEFTKELNAGFTKVQLNLYKLTAFMVVPKSYIDLAPEWLDRYVRTVLHEALSVGLEAAIVTGTGKDQPIGMDRDVSKSASVQNGVYPQLDAIEVTSFGVAEYGSLIADNLATTRNGNPRTINELLMVVNPWDYYSKIVPATTMLTPNGTYARDIFPVPTRVVQSVAVARGTAILGIGSRYFLGMGLSQGGRLEKDDSVRFMQDQRVYAIRTYGNGRPKDDKSFVRLNIAGLKPVAFPFVEAE